MIQIKPIDAGNIRDVCGLAANRDGPCAAGPDHCAAVCIAEAGYHPGMHLNAIYQNKRLIGFFVYHRDERRPDTAVLCRFVLNGPDDGNGAQALAHVLRGLKIQGVKEVVFTAAPDDGAAEALCRSLGFRPAGGVGKTQRRYQRAL